jgi:phenylpyruvate tautomerase PptA (4-oxalocrotonate tautomerase family)
MPIVDIEVVGDAGAPAQTLADALGQAFGSAPGQTWVRLRYLDAGAYAENECAVGADERPVFVTVLHAHPPQGDALVVELRAVTHAVAQCLSRAPQRVHVQYAPPGAGRQAFGGVLR